MTDLPHIIIFNPDQWRGDVMGHLGNPAAHTPNLDAIIQDDAVSFRYAYCQNPVCTPSRCSFMTGWYPHTRGHRTMFFMLQPDEPNLLKRLKEAGYFVWWGGKNDLVPAQYGFDDHCDVKYKMPPAGDRPSISNSHGDTDWRGTPEDDTYYSFMRGTIKNETDEPILYNFDQAMVEGAIDFLRNPPPEAQGKPLCIYLPIGFPHPPYVCEDNFYDLIDPTAIPDRIPAPDDWTGFPSLLKGIYENQRLQTFTEERWTDLRRVYYGMCARVDAQFGLLVDTLKETGRYDDSAIFMFSDHGDFTGDYGLVEKTQNTFEECLTRVPFVVKPPKGTEIQPGIRDALVELIDFPATVEALTGIDRPRAHFGKSLLPLIAGETDEHRDAVFCQGGRRYGETEAMELPSLAKSPDSMYAPRVKLQGDDSGPYHTKGTMLRTNRYKYVQRLYESDQLYDLETDPAEVNNRIDDPELAEVRIQLERRMLHFYLETGDIVPWDTDARN